MGLSASRTLDDQRRRRLVMEIDFDGSVRESARPVPSERSDSWENALLPRLTISLTDGIPAKVWRYWVVGGLVLALSVALLFGWLVAEEASQAGSRLGDQFAFLVERLIRASGVLTWWLAGQLSCLVWWARSRSRVDYSGRFHAWGWAAAGFAVSGFIAAVGAPQLAASLWEFLRGDSAAATGGVTAVWLLPSLVVGLALWGTLGMELRGCLASRVLHTFAAVSGLTFVGLELWLTRTDATLTLEFASKLSLIMMQWCHLMTVLLQVHHTVHISADPPEATPSAWSVVWKQGPVQMLTWVRARLRRTSAVPQSEDKFGDAYDECEPTPEQATAANGERKKRRVRHEAADGSMQEVRIDDAEQVTKGPSRRTKQVARKS